ncbi:hypothetical protein NJ56_10845 [Yersinia ruckeri]|nr:hypothetical protein NJ56_10845 [Yersinia ruckeri]
MFTHQAKLMFHQRVFHLNDLHYFSPIKAVDGQKNREIIPPFFLNATINSLIQINRNGILSLEHEKR